jgi:S1-C subfamily serine protease
MSILVDVAVLIFIAMAGLVGARRGALVLAAGVGGAAFGGVLAWLVVGPVLARSAGSWVALIGVLFGALGAAVACCLIALRLRDRLSPRGRRADKVVGTVLAATLAIAATWFLVLNLARGPSAAAADALSRSVTVRALGSVLPTPPDLLIVFDQVVDRLGAPALFAGVPPIPAEPVDGGPPPAIAALGTQALASSVEVLGRGCIPGFFNQGSGFVIAPGYVMTAAHVVAGTYGQFLYDGDRDPATVVAFDPRLDIAVLHVPTVHVPPLTISAEPSPRRGSWGAAAGFAVGYHPTVSPAAVRRSFSIAGRDIYGRDAVVRALIELQVHVTSGESGGPFVLEDGEVAGMVFANSTVDGGVSYAIASSSLLPIATASIGLDDPVDVGPCVAAP